MTQKRTERLDGHRGTAPLQTGDLGLLATAIVLRGRRALGKRSPKALEQADRALAMPAVRAAIEGLASLAERVTATVDVVKARLADFSQALARHTVGRARAALATLAGAIRSKLPGGR